MQTDYLIISKDKVDYFKRFETDRFKITSIEEYPNDAFMKITIEYDTSAVMLAISEAFTYGAIYGIDLMSSYKRDADESLRHATFNQ
jgi:hypothetical protein